ncbi:hypothetical protein EBB07_13200 [Paenibacillaceae bacterium]|nr:hypothetical protein EBB07_13200 [Paenibacillaceae bacterium]
MSNLLERKQLILISILALFFAIITRNILNDLVYKYCTSIYEVMIADKEPFFSKEANISIETMLFLFLLFNFIVYGLLIRRFKIFAILSLLLNLVSALHVYFFVEVNIIRGL